jgi:EpsI family protein
MDTTPTRRIAAVVIVTAALCAYTWTLRLRTVPEPSPPRFERIPRRLAGYGSRDGYIPPLSLAELGADTTLARTYADAAGDEVELFIGYFASQQERSQIHSPKHCYPGSGWDILSEGSFALRLPGRSEPVRRLVISDGTERRLVLYWFTMRGRVIPNEFALKWDQMTSALLGRTQSAAFVRFSVELPAGREEEARQRLVSFVELVAPDIIDAFTPSTPGTEGG